MNITEFASYCKRRGFVYPNSEIYGGLAGFWDYGPLGVEIKNEIKKTWWEEFVTRRENIVGIDGAIITHPKVWEASGHVDNFTDPLIDCNNCGERHRADHLLEEELKINVEGLTLEDINKLIKNNEVKCPKCKKPLGEARVFNLMFKTHVGPVENEKTVAYLRPETAQLIFTNFKNVATTARLTPPFGIAQIGKAFRNEISPRNFLFRSREFEQMEIEFFTEPKKQKCSQLGEVENLEVNVYTREHQKKGRKHETLTIKECVNKKIMKNEWQAYWNAQIWKYYTETLGVKKERLRLRQHLEEELSHYAEDTWDLEYEFPFGWKEVAGNANRGQYDLKQHMKHSGKNLKLNGETLKVSSEPSLGVDRAFLTIMFDAYTREKERTVLKIKPNLAPIQVAVFPLLKKEELITKAREVYEQIKKEFKTFYDESGSIGRRYRRQDEIGTPYCVTIDYETLQNNTVTIRDRDSMEQERINIKELNKALNNKIYNN